MSLILVDGSALIYRAHYAFARRPLTAPSGEPTSVIFGFLNSVLRLVQGWRPTHLVLAFDLPEPTFRHRIYAAYKATRKPMPEEMAAQLPRLRELLDAWGVCQLSLPGFEADDVMATAARLSAEICERAWFHTGDKDFLQLLDERTGVLKPGRRGDEVVALGAADVERQFGLPPPSLIDVYALAGDASDNIPGAPGIGDKTALQLIQRFGSLRTLYEHLDDPALTPRLRRILEENRDQVMLSRRLFKIDDEAPVSVDWEAARTRLPGGAEVERLLRQLGLRQLAALIERLVAGEQAIAAAAPRAPASAPRAVRQEEPSVGAPGSADPTVSARPNHHILYDDNELQRYLEALPEGVSIAVDTETDDLRRERANLVGIALCAAAGEAVYLPVRVRGEAAGPPATLFDAAPADAVRCNLEWIRPRLGPVLADRRRLKIGQNLKFDEWILERHGLPLAGPRFDTLIASYVLDPGGQDHRLEALARRHLGLEMAGYGDLFAAGDRERDLLSVPLGRLAAYAAADAEAAWRLHGVFAPALAEAGLAPLFHDIEMPLSAVLLRMERHGIRVDLPFLEQLSRRFAQELQALQLRIHEAAGEEFNVQSSRQLARILFDKLGLRPPKKTQTGLSTDVGVLTELAARHPLPALVLEHRQLAKLQNTYVESLAALADPRTGLVHTSFNQAVAATGRLSSSDPNLQNIPVRTEQGRLIRRAFVPRAPDNVFLSADYSQVELRLLAHLSGDAALIAAFRAGADVHRSTAALIAGCSEEAVTPEQRRRAKAINFGVIYGMGARALARQLGVTVREASGFIARYFQTYPGVQAYLQRQRDEARRTGMVTTLLGRRRLLPEIASGSPRLRSLGERMAVNTPIQGTAADIIKVAMIRLDAALRAGGLRSLLLLQVHDELLLETPRAELDAARTLVRECMETVLELSVPLTVDLHVGQNWAEAHG